MALGQCESVKTTLEHPRGHIVRYLVLVQVLLLCVLTVCIYSGSIISWCHTRIMFDDEKLYAYHDVRQNNDATGTGVQTSNPVVS